MGVLVWFAVADTPYLIALALFDQQGRRALPLAGRSQAEVVPEGEVPQVLGHASVSYTHLTLPTKA